jgi:phosphoribulokinase
VEFVLEANAHVGVFNGLHGGAVDAGAKVAHYCVFFPSKDSGL